MTEEDYRAPFFGARWNVAMLYDGVKVDTPVGDLCAHCEEPIRLGEQGIMRQYGSEYVPVHRACDLRSIVGGVNHLRGTCSCHGGPDDPDPPHMTRREAAEAALQFTLTREYQARLR